MEKSNKLKGFKRHLPIKNCKACGKPFQYRNKWKDDWEHVQFCSKACKSGLKSQPKEQQK